MKLTLLVMASEQRDKRMCKKRHFASAILCSNLSACLKIHLLWYQGVWRVTTPFDLCEVCARHMLYESRSLKRKRQFGGILHLMYNIPSRLVAQKYREGKMQSTLERELNVPEPAVG